jgi:hypothetical protein
MKADLLKGLGASALAVLSAALLPVPARVPFVGVLLGVAAGVYPGFALGGTPARERRLQWIVTVAFALVATAGIAFNAWWLTVGWILHALWDALHHAARRGPWVPEHYPMFCLSFDLVLAAYAGVLASGGLG